MNAPYAPHEIHSIDPDFDDADGFESAVISNIQRCGTLDIHPNGWGIHDYIGVYSGHQPARLMSKEERRRHEESLRKRDAEQAAYFAHKLRLQEEFTRETERLAIERIRALESKIASFPHGTQEIAQRVANEFTSMGAQDAMRRGISHDDWIWKRSRFLAGFK